MQSLPSLEGQRPAYSHEVNGELLYELCAALVEAAIGTPEMWAECGGDALKFAQCAITHRIGPEVESLIQRNIEYDLEISDMHSEGETPLTGKLVVSISCGGCGYIKVGPAIAALEREAEGLGAAFYWTLIQALYRTMRIYDLSDAEVYEENLIEYAESDSEENRSEYEFPEVEKAIPACIKRSQKSRSDLWRIEYRRLLARHREGRYGSWIRRLRMMERLSHIKTKAQDPSEYSGNYDGPPLPALLVVFEDHDAISACFDEESQHMLEVSSEPNVCAVFSPASMEEFSDAVRVVERFVRFNEELCRLIEDIQSLETQNEGRDIDRGGASLRAR
ncbi:MAG: hypothetical protein JOZ83_16960 [Silvibacterium sp.]|nr:hypothetical protein [Silvibacterium sp.]